jgi:hypothetical protein
VVVVVQVLQVRRLSLPQAVQVVMALHHLLQDHQLHAVVVVVAVLMQVHPRQAQAELAAEAQVQKEQALLVLQTQAAVVVEVITQQMAQQVAVV